MATFKSAKELERYLKKALDSLQAEVIITTQAGLGSAAVSPIKDGRLRSSWFAAEGSPSSEVPAEDANSPNSDATSLRVDSSKQYHLTSNLPYAQYICLENGAVSKSKNWFIDFRDARIPEIQGEAARKIKQMYDL